MIATRKDMAINLKEFHGLLKNAEEPAIFVQNNDVAEIKAQMDFILP